jgi:hypothetical protein
MTPVSLVKPIFCASLLFQSLLELESPWVCPILRVLIPFVWLPSLVLLMEWNTVLGICTYALIVNKICTYWIIVCCLKFVGIYVTCADIEFITFWPLNMEYLYSCMWRVYLFLFEDINSWSFFLSILKSCFIAISWETAYNVLLYSYIA